MMKLLIVTSSGQVGGVEKITYNLWQELKKKNIEVKVLKIFKDNDNDYYSYGEDELVIWGNKRLRESNFFKKIYRLIKDTMFISFYKYKYNINTTLAMGEMCSFLSGLSLGKDLKIASIHGKKVKYDSNIISNISIYSYKKTDKIICISEGIKNDIILNFKKIDSGKISVIYNPHNKEEIILKGEEKISSEEEKIFFKKVIIYAGRIDENKGIIHLLKIFSLKKEELKDFNLVILGECLEEPEYKKIVDDYRKESNIHFLGFKNNPYKYIKRSFATILTSYSEGLPNVLIESLILGVPVISTNSSEGIWEILIKNHRNTLYDSKLSSNFIGDVGIICPRMSYNEYFEKELTFRELEIQKAILILNKEYLRFLNNIDWLLEKFNKDVIIENYLKSFQ